MNATIEQKIIITPAAIAKVAWQIWEKEGRQPGRDLDYWLRAEQQVLAASLQESSRTNAGAPLWEPVAEMPW